MVRVVCHGVRHGVRSSRCSRFIQFALGSCYALAHKRIVTRFKVYIERSNIQVKLIRFRKQYRLNSRLLLRCDGPPIGHDPINTIHANLFATSPFAR